MKSILAVVFLVLFAVSTLAFAGEMEDLQSDYNKTLQALSKNIETQQMLMEGFKASNPTYRALVDQQQRLQKSAQDLAKKMQALQNPPEEPEAPEEK